MTSPVKKAIFPVGGLGTRFLPATKAMPKEMLPVVDKPLIQYAFEEAQAAGIEQFIFITGRNKNIISNHFDHAYELQTTLDTKRKEELLSLTKDWLPDAGQVAFIRQQQPLGLGHAIWCARHFIGDEPFAILLADELTLAPTPLLKQMVDLHQKEGGNILGLAEVTHEETSRYGIVAPKEDYDTHVSISDMVEKPAPEDAPSNLSITGRYILNPEIFMHLENGAAGAGGEIQLTDAMVQLLKQENQPFHGVRFTGQRFDCGNRRGFVEANIAFALAQDELRDHVYAFMQQQIKK